MADHDERPETDRGECLICKGSGSLPVILGDDEQQARCDACLGSGVQLSRNELADGLDSFDWGGASINADLLEDLADAEDQASAPEGLRLVHDIEEAA